MGVRQRVNLLKLYINLMYILVRGFPLLFPPGESLLFFVSL